VHTRRRLGKRLKSEVQSRLLTLLFTLLAIIVIGAGVFFEIETRYGVRDRQAGWHVQLCSRNTATAQPAAAIDQFSPTCARARSCCHRTATQT
jgi:hypothetical protein